MTALRIALADLVADRRRSLLTIVAIVPIVASYLVLLGVADGLEAEGSSAATTNILLVSPDALDPSAGRLDPAVLDHVAEIGGSDIAALGPGIFRSLKVEDRILQLRGAAVADWEDLYRLTVVEGSPPRPGADEVAITEGVVIATGWNVGSVVEIYGTRFTVSALVRASGTRFVSVWMDYARAVQLFEGATGFQLVTIRPAAGADPAQLLDRLEGSADDRYAAFFESDLADRQSALDQVAGRISAVSTAVGICALAFAGFNLTALTLAERRRDLAIARTIGFRRSEIAVVTALRSVVLSVAAFAVGGAAAWVVVAATGPTTLRATVIDVAIPGGAWAIGLLVSVGAPALGAGLALGGAARTPIRELLEGA